MVHVPLGVARDQLSLKFELHNGSGFLHAGHHDILSHPCPLNLKTGCRIICVNRARQQIEGLDRGFRSLPQAA